MTDSLHPAVSKHYFVKLLAEAGLDSEEPTFKKRGWTCASDFAQVCGVNYVNVNERTFAKKVILKIVGLSNEQFEDLENEPPVANRLRKLFNACGTILQQDLKRKHGGQKESITSLDDDELVRRRKDMRALLSPMKLRGQLEHAYCIDQDVVKMYQKNYLIYIHPKHCPTRSQEIIHEELSGKANRPGAPGLAEELQKLATLIKEHEKPRLETDVNKCVLALTEAYQRRGMAFHVVGIMSWPQLEKIREFLIDALREEPPEGRDDLSPATFHDVIAADKRIFIKLNELCEDGIRPNSKGLPLDTAVSIVLQDRKILAMVDVRPTGLSKRTRSSSPPRAPSKTPAPAWANTENNRAKRQRQAVARKKTASELSSFQQKGKGKGKWKGEQSDENWITTPPLPPPGKKGGTGNGGKGGKGKHEQGWSG